MKACERPGCGRLHDNRKYCSYACRNKAIGAWANTQRLEQYKASKRKVFGQLMARMIQRVRYLGQTEEERLILAWRFGAGAGKSRRHRAKGQGA